jgi:hypothetical protein
MGLQGMAVSGVLRSSRLNCTVERMLLSVESAMIGIAGEVKQIVSTPAVLTCFMRNGNPIIQSLYLYSINVTRLISFKVVSPAKILEMAD